jgi:hypothetical protein
VRVGLCMSVKTAFRGLPAGHRPAPRANVPDGQRRDGRPQRRSASRITDSRSIAKGGRAQYRRRCSSD